MTDQQAEPNAGGQNQPRSWQDTVFSILRSLFMYWLISQAMSRFMGSNQTSTSSPLSSSSPEFKGLELDLSVKQIKPLWRGDTRFDVYVVVSESCDPPENYDTLDSNYVELWRTKNLPFHWGPPKLAPRSVNRTVELSDLVRLNNGTIFAHIYFIPRRKSLAPVYHLHQLNVYRKAYRPAETKNLLNSKETGMKKETDVEADAILSHWRPQLSIRLVVDHTTFKPGSIPDNVVEHYFVDSETGLYEPVVYIDTFWHLLEDYREINETTKSMELEVVYSHIGLFQWQIQLQMEQSFNMQKQWGSTEQDTDQFRRMLLETNPILLATTFVVSILHMVFDFLAFKNDISFWKEAKSMEGLSIRTIFINVFCQFIIILYLFDQDTSWMILLSSSIGLVIELWKVTRAVDVEIVQGQYLPFFLKFTPKTSYVESETAEWDREAMTYLSYAIAPCLVGYTIYSVMYLEHKSWYSFIVSTLVGAVYAFGFILSCPQLYLNYKLKSVAHLPWRMLTYKALNTFIDDLFAFIIKMPTLHRIACFRDDIVFFIYLYQRWAYRVDYTRVNEFGLVPDQDSASNANHKKNDDDVPSIMKEESIERTDAEIAEREEQTDSKESQSTLRQRTNAGQAAE